MTTDIDKQVRPRFVVCEDGQEYLERFKRFLGNTFEFIPAQDFFALVEHTERCAPVAGVLLDLDFRRVDAAHLVNEHGQAIAKFGREARAQYSANQGLFILASLRERCILVPVLLFADIDDPEQQAHLLRKFGPLDLVPSHVGLRELERRLAELSGVK